MLNNVVLKPVSGSYFNMYVQYVNIFLSHLADILLSWAVPLQVTWH